MPNKPKFKSDAFAAIHSTAQGLYRAEAIDKTTLRVVINPVFLFRQKSPPNK